jgi:UPF0716 protein FxsA
MWLVAFFVGAVLELWVFVQVANAIGFLPALLAVLAVTVVGLWLVKIAGLGVLRRAQEASAKGQPVGKQAVDGVLLLASGVLIAIPGFVTGAMGLVLLLPPARAAVRGVAKRSLERGVQTGRVTILGSKVYRPGVREATAREEGRPELGQGDRGEQ